MAYRKSMIDRPAGTLTRAKAKAPAKKKKKIGFRPPAVKEYGGEIAPVARKGFKPPVVKEMGGEIKPIKEPSAGIKLPGLKIIRMGDIDPHTDPRSIMDFPTLISMFSLGAGVGAIVSKVLSKTAVSTLAKIGTTGRFEPWDVRYFGEMMSERGIVATTFATNTVTSKITKTWLAKWMIPAAVGLFISAVGSYPFAGFIKEEALQTLSFGTHSAIKSGDIEGAETALQETRETLNPSATSNILNGIPFVNVVKNLVDFFEAAKIKMAIDEKLVSDLKIQIETGESDDQKWARIKQEEDDMFRASVEFHLEKKKDAIDYANQAYANSRTAQRKADKKAMLDQAAFWLDYQKKLKEMEEADRIAIAKFWFEYRKLVAKLSAESRPSNLKFGLL